jgi:hypothetical protein
MDARSVVSFFSWRIPPHPQQSHPLRVHLSSPWNTCLSTGLKLGGAWTSVIDGEGLVTDWEGRSAGTRVVFLSDCLVRCVWVYRCIRAEIISAIVGRYRCEGEWLVGGWLGVVGVSVMDGCEGILRSCWFVFFAWLEVEVWVGSWSIGYLFFDSDARKNRWEKNGFFVFFAG